MQPEAGPFEGWSIEGFVEQFTSGWTARACFYSPTGCPVDVEFDFAGPAAVDGPFPFPDESSAKGSLWVAITGCDRGMPDLRFRVYDTVMQSDAAGLRSLLDAWIAADDAERW